MTDAVVEDYVLFGEGGGLVVLMGNWFGTEHVKRLGSLEIADIIRKIAGFTGLVRRAAMDWCAWKQVEKL